MTATATVADLLARATAAAPPDRLDALRGEQQAHVSRADAAEAANEAAGLRRRADRACKAARKAAREVAGLAGGEWFADQLRRLERKLAWWAGRSRLRAAVARGKAGTGKGGGGKGKPPAPPPWPRAGEQLLLWGEGGEEGGASAGGPS